MIYAPVIIPTVNRYKHFKECLESLSRCTWADKTDVFIAVDYPGKEEHWEGYCKIKDYLSKCGDLGFKSLNVTYRETNYFFSGKGNAGSLIKEVYKKYDRIIYSEDDNVFSPNFLVYINKGLVEFENDPTVFAICGYKHFYPVKFSNNTFFRQNVDFSAWGYGIWINRQQRYINQITPAYFRSKLSWKNIWHIWKNGNNRLERFLFECNSNKICRNDNTYSVMMPIEGLDVIMPKVSLVRNMGWDKSGQHCDTTEVTLSQKHLNQEISSEKYFEFVGKGTEFYEENRRIIVRHSYGRISTAKLLKSIVKFFIKQYINRTSK